MSREVLPPTPSPCRGWKEELWLRSQVLIWTVETQQGRKFTFMETTCFLMKCFSCEIPFHSHNPRNWLFEAIQSGDLNLVLTLEEEFLNTIVLSR